ncbi:MAG TPA: putative toxin-antitoxin system toxin component, PIN family [Terracidiphilus sp.]|nr:putative toxin-antitoxin system toxin component, PIN family [Terracidiphilus sp.]
MTPRTVFDTNAVVSALLFSAGRLAWLRDHWKHGECVPLISRATAAELVRVLAYPKFKLPPEDRMELLGDYLPFCETVEVVQPCPQRCRDERDQAFLDLAFSGNADVLVTGDSDLLALDDWTRFSIESPESYRLRLSKPD